jgi:hypothetical protein
LQSQDKFFSNVILGANQNLVLGVPVNSDKAFLGYHQGVKRLTRGDWLKDPVRAEISQNLQLPGSFTSLEDSAALISMPARSASIIGLWLAVGTIAIALVAYLVWSNG